MGLGWNGFCYRSCVVGNIPSKQWCISMLTPKTSKNQAKMKEKGLRHIWKSIYCDHGLLKMRIMEQRTRKASLSKV